MNEQHIHDAIGEISEELIDPVARLRMKKRYPVAKWVAAAACVCLVLLSVPLGLSALSGGTKAESADRAPEMNMGDAYGGIMDQASEVQAEVAVFRAKVLEVHEKTVLVEPLEGEMERNSCDKIYVSLTQLQHVPIIQPGDILQIQYNGRIMESYPGQINIAYAIEVIE